MFHILSEKSIVCVQNWAFRARPFSSFPSFKYFLANSPLKRSSPLSVNSLRKNKLCEDTEWHDKNTIWVRNMNQKIVYEGKGRKKSKEKNISLLMLSLHFIDLSGHKRSRLTNLNFPIFFHRSWILLITLKFWERFKLSVYIVMICHENLWPP